MPNAAPPERPSTKQLPPVSFATFLVSLGHTAMEQLHAKSSVQDLQIARQTIDLLSVLREKTRGNLDDEEKQLMDSLLGDLETRWTQARQN